MDRVFVQVNLSSKIEKVESKFDVFVTRRAIEKYCKLVVSVSAPRYWDLCISPTYSMVFISLPLSTDACHFYARTIKTYDGIRQAVFSSRFLERGKCF
ncbi:unnamed protein product [Hermetia illucens]|uniref:Uncharacterized protein n=1 Tax=Hermetia illucens TaxID=343691 RepID=A0A7R8YWX3_HERIL|nr:unnamed protein product [Hermetia illucens]